MFTTWSMPPSAIFAVADRDFPLILPTHDKCNHGWTEADCRIGELVGVLHGRALEPGKSKLEFAGSEFSDGSVGAAVRGLGIGRLGSTQSGRSRSDQPVAEADIQSG
jgi:hypothetical protein